METSTNSYQEASDVLAEALKQMDGILAETLKREHKNHNGLVEAATKNHNGLVDAGSPKPTHSPKLHNSRAVKLLNDLHLTLDIAEDRSRIFRQLSPDTQTFFQQWMSQCSNQKLSNGYSSSENLEDKVRKLEADKDNLTLQVSVLSDQIEAQVEKIRDLERGGRYCRNGNPVRLGNDYSDVTDGDILSMDLLTRTMPAAHDMHKLDLMAENSNIKLRLAGVEREKSDLESRLQYAQNRIDDLQSRLNDQTIELTELRMRATRNGTIPSSPDPSDMSRDRTLEREKTLDRLKRKHSEVDKLKKAVEALMLTNSEKDRHIEDLNRQMMRYGRLEEIKNGHGRRGHDNLSPDDYHSDSSSTHNSNTSANDTVVMAERYDNIEHPNHHPELRHMLPNATSTPVAFGSTSPKSPVRNLSLNITPPTGTTQMPPPKKPLVPVGIGIGRSSSCENMKPKNGTPPLIRPGQGYGAQTETEEEALKDEMAQQYKQLQKQRQSSDQPKKHKNKGIKRFFGKLRRSNSQEMDSDKLEEFKRSGLRATAGARLGWSRDLKLSEVDSPFPRWDTDRVSAWLHALGLSMYVGECKRWVKNGQQLLNATSQDLEKELGIRSHFHRKKLQLALQSVNSEKQSPINDLDFNWVTRWLDDLGLSQYKDSFLDARVDGRMLHYMTVDELVALKVTNTLHHLSLKQAIQVLRLNQFNGDCLKRRPVPEEGSNSELQNVPEDVMLWTNHRVMEWLRSIDLSEYAPNLRGSGVHGALMVLEPRFSYEIFASLLSIPGNKTLLRRHLSTHYITLIGSDMQQKKRELQSQPGYIPLTPNQKVKLKKRLFSHRRTRSESAEDDLVCPVGEKTTDKVLPNGQSNGSPVWNKDGTLHRSDKENMLAKDRFLDNVPTSDV